MKLDDITKVSVVIATYNSINHLDEVINALRSQVQVSLEIICVDGGSTDGTVERIQKLGLTLLENEARDPINAKWIGFLAATNDYVVFYDHDERPNRVDSITLKCSLFKKYPNLGIVFSTGYNIQKMSTISNIYTSKYGDPFNQFVYKHANDTKRVDELLKILVANNEVDYIVTEGLYKEKKNILLETSSMGVMIKKSKVQRSLNIEGAGDLPLLVYLPRNGSEKLSFAILKNDLIEHHSSETWRHVRNKLKWRVYTQVSSLDILNNAGLYRRYSLENSLLSKQLGKGLIPLRFKLGVFAIQRMLLVPSVLNAFKFFIETRKINSLWVIHLDYYLLGNILLVTLRKMLGLTPVIRHYSRD
jgi:glycosyltransferase involved in cell wall biosynthesis